MGVTSKYNQLNSINDDIVRFAAGTFLHLFKNDVTPDADMNGVTFTPADYGGYNSIDISEEWGTADLNGDDKYEVSTTPQTFAHDGMGDANTVYGYWISDGSEFPIMAHRFAEPVEMDAGHSFELIVRYTVNEEA